MAADRTVDPITTEIIRSAFTSAADEMNAALIRSAYTPIIYELKDCSVALLDAEHRVLGQSSGLPIFLGNLEICATSPRRCTGASLAAGRRLDHERLVPRRHPPERHDRLRPDLPRRRSGRLRRLARALARRRRQGCRAGRWTRPRSTRRDSGSVRPAGRGRRASPGRRRSPRRNSRFSYQRDRRPQGADRRAPHRRAAPGGLHRPLRRGDGRRRARGDLRADGATRARRGQRDPGRRLRGRGIARRRRLTDTPVRRCAVKVDGRPDDSST